MSELCDIAYKYGTDKCPQNKHHFTEFYYSMFSDRKYDVKKVVEIGIGKLLLRDEWQIIGASLRMWRDFFPNAFVYGADIDKELLFDDERIHAVYCDQTREYDLERLVAVTGNDVDLFVDDGLHSWESQVFTANIIVPLLKSGSIYVIEDVIHKRSHYKYLNFNHEFWTPPVIRYKDDRLIIIKKD
jgi:hypothetical protein